jgi:hypothetical protein
MTRPLFVLASLFLLGSGVAVEEADPNHETTALASESLAVQAIPQNASASRRGGWICDNGYAKRAQACVTVAEATDAEVRQQMIARSFESYSGSCACPDNRNRAGRRCGSTSAYSRPGRASPLCYERDISDEVVAKYRERYTP